MRGGIPFDQVAPDYDATRRLPAGAEHLVADRLAERIAGARTLEVGVGTARWAMPLQARGVEIVGADLSAPMLQVARSKGFARAVRADLIRLPFPDGRFDGVLANRVLHLVFDVPRALREIVRVCRRRLRSVLEFETARPDVVESYLAFVRARGAGRSPPGLSERRLAEALRPDWRGDVTRFHSRGPASRKIDAVAARSFRDTWATPEAVHRAAVAGLRREFGDVDEITETRAELAEWDRSRLLQFADTYRSPTPTSSPRYRAVRPRAPRPGRRAK